MSGLGPQGREILDRAISPEPKEQNVDDETTLAGARSWVAGRLYDGVKCPCCDQHAQLYQRKLNSGIAHALILLYQAGAGHMWVHKPTVLKGKGASARDESIARYWGLLEEESTVKRDDGGRAGYWRLTARGVQFVRNVAAVPKYARIYNGHCRQLIGEPVTISQCLGSRFDYRELMATGSESAGQ